MARRPPGLRILVTGASGNIGTALLRRLASEPGVAQVLGICRRPPDTDAEPYRSVTWHARLQPTSEGWIDLVRRAPLTSTERARTQLAWRPRVPAIDALTELVRAIGEGAGTPSPALLPRGRG
jgi:UDP-glucose 4-epimerase